MDLENKPLDGASYEHLKRSLEQYERFIDKAPIAIAVHKNGKLMYVNEAAVRMIEAESEKQLIGLEIAKIVHPDSQKLAYERMKAIYEGKKLFTNPVVEKFVTLKGNVIHVQVISQLFMFNGEKAVQVMCINITDKIRSEEIIRESEERFRMLTDSAPVLIWMCNEHKDCTYVNKPWCDFTGRKLEQELKRGWTQNVHPGDAQSVRELFGKAFDSRSRVTLEYRLKRHDGVYRWMAVEGTPYFSAAGTFLGYIGTSIDVTDRKDAMAELEKIKSELELRVDKRTEELTKANQELARSNKELEDFAYIASHDLQEPLRKISSFSNLLVTKYKGDLPENAQTYINSMQKASIRMGNLINDLLAYSRVATHVLPFKKVNLKKVVEDVLDDLNTRIEQTNARITVDGLETVYADSSQMRQLFQNLISNALKYRKKETPPKVSITSKHQETFCIIRVKDNGIGFDEKYTDRIFTIFQRLHGKSEYEGTGIGLAICKKIVQRHNGEITARSKLGKGSTFIIKIPYRQK